MVLRPGWDVSESYHLFRGKFFVRFINLFSPFAKCLAVDLFLEIGPDQYDIVQNGPGFIQKRPVHCKLFDIFCCYISIIETLL